MGSIVAIVNNKGGVGKTTIACNLAHAIARRGRRVLVVDVDAQCNSTSLLLPPDRPIRHSLYELLDPDTSPNEISPQSYIYSTKYAGVSCLPNVPETAALEPHMILKSPQTFFLFRERMRAYLTDAFDVVLIDNPPNIGTFVLCSLYASDYVIVPIKAGSAFSLEGLTRALAMIEEIRRSANPHLRFFRVLVNYIDRRTIISRTVLDQVQAHFLPGQIFATTIPVSTAFEQAELLRQTVLQYAPSSHGARAIRDLAVEFLGHLEHIESRRKSEEERHDDADSTTTLSA